MKARPDLFRGTVTGAPTWERCRRQRQSCTSRATRVAMRENGQKLADTGNRATRPRMSSPLLRRVHCEHRRRPDEPCLPYVGDRRGKKKIRQLNSRRPSSAFVRVTWSAYSRSPRRKAALRVTHARAAAVAQVERVGLALEFGFVAGSLARVADLEAQEQIRTLRVVGHDAVPRRRARGHVVAP